MPDEAESSNEAESAPAEPVCKPGFDASFVQLSAAQFGHDEAAWHKELQVLRDLGVRSVVLQFSGDEHGAYDGRGPKQQPVRALLRAAASFHMEVYLGLYADPNWPERWSPRQRVAPPLGKAAGRAWLKALSRESSLAGFYIPQEIDEQTWEDPKRLAQLGAFLENTAKALRAIRSDLPIAIAPFYAESRSPEQYADFFQRLLKNRPADILMLQDGAGARGTEPAKIAQTLRALRDVLEPKGTELWSVVEVFRQTGGSPIDEGEFSAIPDELARICASITAERPLVRRMVAFSVLDYMHPSAAGKQKQLYDGYRATLR